MSAEGGGLPGLGVRRPLLVLVINLLIAIAGIAAILAVEVRELPDVDRPIVVVRATFPGASPETMDAEVTRIIEGAVARVSGVSSIESSSEENSGRVRIEFRPGANLDTAASDVREAVSRVQRDLPEDVEELLVIKADDDADPVVRLAVWSATLDEQELTRIVEQDIVPEFISIDGVADVPLNGNRERQMRVMVDPSRLAGHGLSMTDVATVLRTASFDVPAGSFRSDDQELVVRADASTVTPEAVEEMIIRGGIRIGDVADVFFGPADATSYVRLDGRPVIGMGIVRQAQSNTIQISDEAQRVAARLNERFEDVNIVVTSDDAVFIRGSVTEVLLSLSITVAIVILAIWIFMGSWPATVVLSVAIPISLIGTVAAIWALGFSINIVTLLALVLATGLVVDDSIVVLENIQRRRAQGIGGRAAAVLGTQQVFFAVVATTSVLISVFLPISFLPSTAGRLFREFGFVLAIAVAISSFVSLSLVPAMAARLSDSPPKDTKLRRGLNTAGQRASSFYRRILHLALAAPLAALGIGLAAAIGAALLFSALDQELVPPEDRGVINIRATGPDGVGLSYSERQADWIETILRPYLDSGEIESLYTVVGRWDPNRVSVTAPLADWSERDRDQQAIIEELQGPMARIPGARVNVHGSSSLDVGGGIGGIEVALTGPDYAQIYDAARALSARIESELDNLSNVEISYQPTQPQLSFDLDRRRAADLGVSLEDISSTLRAMIDGDDLVDLNVDDQAVPVILESRTGAIENPSDLRNLFVRNDSGGLVSLYSLATVREEGVAAELDRHGQRRAIEVEAEVAQGYPLQSAVDDLRRLAADLPPGIDMIMLGEAATLEETSKELALTYIIALVVVLLVLIAQFESVSSALVVMAVVPFGIAAAVYALFFSGISLNIYSQIGLVMLIGLMAKNGILVVEFADQLRDEGLPIREAIEQAAWVRLRPIGMTILSTVLGALPLILSTGPGAEARVAIGWVIFGGLGLATIFTLFLTPVMYLGLARFSKPRAAEGDRLASELERASTIADKDMERPT
ncbi:efflux RND transporter permease subunit [Iodidimonas sp. SYSU 1G8]|uniref:efflux RND transporter permease subunit n=1 Tax=Iodidimonas sp. SYSU 1G8 TaxID=3133967 RepID=UPI0031FE97A5